MLLTWSTVPETSARAVTNLLPSGGFESGQWKLTKWDRGLGQTEFCPDGRAGTKAVKLTGISDARAHVNLLAHCPPIDVQAGREYVLSVWHRAAGGAVPTVSIFGFKEPWAAAQWKTPQSVYQTRRLPPSEHWSPWTWRFRVAAGSVQLIVAVRNDTIGSVWFDNVALCEAGETRLTVVEPGTIARLPDKRRLQATLAMADASARWRLSLSEQATGKQLALEEASAAKKTVQLSYAAPDGTPLLLALEDTLSGAVLATEEIAAPPLLAMAKTPGNDNLRVRALRGYLRIARQFALPDAQRLAMYREGLAAARRDEERKLAVEVLLRIRTPESLALAAESLSDPALRETAARVAVGISGKIVAEHPAAVAQAMRQILKAGTQSNDLAVKAGTLLHRALEAEAGKPVGL